MGYFKDNTVEVEHNGIKVRVCKNHAHTFQKSEAKPVAKKEPKTEK